MRRKKGIISELSEAITDILERIIGAAIVIVFLYMFILWLEDKTKFWNFFYSIFGLFIIIAILSFLFLVFWKRIKTGKIRKWLNDRELLTYLREMTPQEFESYISSLFSKLGYKTRVVGGKSDGGIDVIAEKEGVKYYIQCKKFITSKVGVRDIRDFYGSLADHLSEGKGYFITTNIFTLEAEEFAKNKPIELIDGAKLIRYIRLAEKGIEKK